MSYQFRQDGFMMAELDAAIAKREGLDREGVVKSQAAEKARELAEQERELVIRARVLASARATYAGSHVYLGGDALTRDYYSPWYPIASVVEHPDVSIQAQLERDHKVTRQGGIEYDNGVFDVIVNARYQHLPTEVTTGVHPLLEFDDEGITSFRAPDHKNPDPFRVGSDGPQGGGMDHVRAIWERTDLILSLIEDADPSTGIMGPGFPYA